MKAQVEASDCPGPGEVQLWVKSGAGDYGAGWGRIGLLRIRTERDK